ncbi:MAG: hypothetical protein ACJ768_11105 [Gaiellaceae bacterium]
MAKDHDPFKILDNTFTGRGHTFEKAIESAWEQAKESGPGTFRIVDIYFAAENPISEYSVIIGRHA